MSQEQPVPSISRRAILDMIGSELGQVAQWSSTPTKGFAEITLSHLHRAESLIELLEIQDCGSVGGFDHDYRGQQPHPRTLFDRWDWLYRKYYDPSKCKFASGTKSYGDIKTFFTRAER